MKLLLASAAAFLLVAPAFAKPPPPAPYRFTIIGDDTYFYLSFDIPISPTPDRGSNFAFFSVSNIPVNTLTTPFTGQIFFYLNDPSNPDLTGGIEVDDPDGDPIISSDGPTLYTLSGTKPTFKTGSFALTDFYDRSEPMPTDLHHYTITIGAAADAPPVPPPPPPPPPSVPEPVSWAMIVAGFGAIGGALRARRRVVRFG